MANPPRLIVVAEELRKRRLAKVWSRLQLAEESGVSEGTIKLLEAGKDPDRGVQPGTVQNLATALGCEPSDISEVVVGAEPAEAAS